MEVSARNPRTFGETERGRKIVSQADTACFGAFGGWLPATTEAWPPEPSRYSRENAVFTSNRRMQKRTYGGGGEPTSYNPMKGRSLGDSNPCLRRERAVSWATRRRELIFQG